MKSIHFSSAAAIHQPIIIILCSIHPTYPSKRKSKTYNSPHNYFSNTSIISKIPSLYYFNYLPSSLVTIYLIHVIAPHLI